MKHALEQLKDMYEQAGGTCTCTVHMGWWAAKPQVTVEVCWLCNMGYLRYTRSSSPKRSGGRITWRNEAKQTRCNHYRITPTGVEALRKAALIKTE